MSTRTSEERLARILAFHDLLGRFAREVGPALELAPVLRIVLRAMRTLVPIRGGSIALVENGYLRIAAAHPDEQLSDEVRAARLPLGEGLTGRVAATGEPVYSPNLDEDPRVDRALRRLGSNRDIMSYLAVPLVCLGEVTGVLQIDATEANAFDEDDVRLLSGLATQVAGSIESARRHEAIVSHERLKNDFVARVSHELRTPVAILSGYVNVLRDRRADDEHEREGALDGIEEATGQLHDLVEQLLDITSLQAGIRPPEPTNVDAGDILADVQASWQDKGVLLVTAPERGRRLRVDADVLARVLGLLVDNAQKYGAGADVRLVEDGRDGMLRFEVRNRQSDVPDVVRDSLFDRFVRGHERPPGLGLGLWLARALGATIGAHVELADAGDRARGAVFAVSVVALPSVSPSPAREDGS